jgi:hypothetical protein
MAATANPKTIKIIKFIGINNRPPSFYFKDHSFQLKKTIKSNNTKFSRPTIIPAATGTFSCPTRIGTKIETKNTKNVFSRNPSQNL